MFGAGKGRAAGPTSNLHGCWNHGCRVLECLGRVREELQALYQTSMDVGTTAAECHGDLRPQLLALHQTSMDVGTMASECHALHQTSMDVGTTAEWLCILYFS